MYSIMRAGICFCFQDDVLIMRIVITNGLEKFMICLALDLSSGLHGSLNVDDADKSIPKGQRKGSCCVKSQTYKDAPAKYE